MHVRTHVCVCVNRCAGHVTSSLLLHLPSSPFHILVVVLFAASNSVCLSINNLHHVNLGAISHVSYQLDFIKPRDLSLPEIGLSTATMNTKRQDTAVFDTSGEPELMVVSVGSQPAGFKTGLPERHINRHSTNYRLSLSIAPFKLILL